METAAPLKSEIGEGRRRLLFSEAVAAMASLLCLSVFTSLSLSLSLSLLCLQLQLL
uniref:Uncharacterized protein n=1 Tax=Arundo donax TaxID=35708 RepID=A0A0A9F7W3_ARUDO